MKRIKLWGRTEKHLPLVEEPEPYSTYAEAVLAGQQKYGHGNFNVDTGEKIPSRKEQLGVK